MPTNESYRRERGDFTDEQKQERTADGQIRFFGALEEFARWRKRHDVNALGVDSVSSGSTGHRDGDAAGQGATDGNRQENSDD